MRCRYCRSITHEIDCPKELEDRVLPLYSAIHKLGTVERRAASQQQPLYALKDAIALREQIKVQMRELILTENAKNLPEEPKKPTTAKKT